MTEQFSKQMKRAFTNWGTNKVNQNYLPGRLLLEIYYDYYPFNRYYKTNPDGTVDLKWSGINLIASHVLVIII